VCRLCSAYATITATIMSKLPRNVMGSKLAQIIVLASIVSLSNLFMGGATVHAELTNRSPNPLDVSAGGVPGAVSHLLKRETVADVPELHAAVYYPTGSGDGGSGKVLKIRYGSDGKKCIINNIGGHYGEPKAVVRIIIEGANTVTYKVRMGKVCDDVGSSARTNVEGGDWNNNKFYADYPLPKLKLDPASNTYKADITIKYSNEVNEGPSDSNSMNFVLIATGSSKAKIGPVGEASSQYFGIRSAFQAGSKARDVVAGTQFGIPCNIKPNKFAVKLYDADTGVFGDTYLWVTEDGKKLPKTRYENTGAEAKANWDGDNLRWKSYAGSGSNNALVIKDPKKSATYKFFIKNPAQSNKLSPNMNVLSVGIPYDSIYGDIDCDPDTADSDFTPYSSTPELVEPNGLYTFRGRISGGSVPKKPGESSYRNVPFAFHKIQYKPGVNPFGKGTELSTRAFDNLDCNYFNGPTSDPTNTRCVVQNPAGSGNMPMSGGTASSVKSGNVTEPFPDDSYSQEPGSTICYAVSVKRPSEVLVHEYKERHEHDTGVLDKDGVMTTYKENHDRYDYYYRDENHNHKNSGWDPYTGGINHVAEKREWATAISCLMVGKRPRVQVLSNDLRVRQSDTVARVTSYDNGRYYGSWIEYGTFVFGQDADVASGAGLRGGSKSDINERSEWSKLTFANHNTYGDYTTLGTQAQPDIAGHIANKTKSAPNVPNASNVQLASLTGSAYKSSGTTIFSGSNTNITGTKLIYIDGTARINTNITLREGSYSNPADIPQVIIVANNIDIADSVTRIDAWLVTKSDGGPDPSTSGAIDTCYNGPAHNQRNTNACNQQLVVNGATVSSRLELNRTGPVAFDPDSAAEVFRGRLDMYVWAYENQRKSSGNVAQTVDVVEAPARF
jgi:hypothetical protein